MAGLAGLLAGCGLMGQGREAGHKPLAEFEGRYWPVSKAMEATMGEMTLSETRAYFTKLDGGMELQYARKLSGGEVRGTWFDGVGENGAPVYLYRVVNAGAYHDVNKGKNGACPQPVKWLAVSPQARDRSVSVCTVSDAKGDLNPNKPGVCGCGMYEKSDR